MAPRIIHLRRPATLSVQDEPFVPDCAKLDEIDRRWAALCRENPNFYDGRLYHVIGVHRNGCGGAVLHVADCAYRFHAVQDERFDLGVRALGVKGITMRVADNAVLLGRRSDTVAHYRGLWEFAPGGVVEPTHAGPAATIVEELREEAGYGPRAEPVAIALVQDVGLRTWEMAFRIEVDSEDQGARSVEYSELLWCAVDELPDELSPLAQQMLGLLSR